MNPQPHTSAGAGLTKLVLEVFRLNGTLLAYGDRLCRPFGLTSARWQVLGALAIGEPQTAAQIARNMGLKRQSVQRLVDALIRKRLLRSEENPHHRRARLIKLTPAGAERYARISAVQAVWANETGAGLDARKLDAVAALLMTLTSRLRK